jgi:hypothetical protein
MTTDYPAGAGGSRRDVLGAAALVLAASALPHEEARAQPQGKAGGLAPVSGTEHWTAKRAGTDNVGLPVAQAVAKSRSGERTNE